MGETELRNAVTLYSGLVNLSRILGPMLAGTLIITIGIAPCFLLNGFSYLAVVFMLLVMRPAALGAATLLRPRSV